MVTYPSTHGVYEDTIGDLCDLVHAHGGQVYVDGANLNALLGYAKPGEFGGDVSPPQPAQDLLHPPRWRRSRGGSGRGARPPRAVPAVARDAPGAGQARGHRPISAAPYGSAGILPISWAYIRLMGAEGLTRATAVAVLSANYMAARLRDAFPVLYTGTRRARGPRVHPRRARPHQGHRRHRRRRRQAADRLRLPRADHVVPGRRHPDGGADRVRGPGRDRPVLRRDDRRSAPRSTGSARGSGAPGRRRCAAPRTPRGPWSASGTVPTPARWPSSPPGSTPTSTGPRWRGSTRPTATATWSAPARRRRRSRSNSAGPGYLPDHEDLPEHRVPGPGQASLRRGAQTREPAQAEVGRRLGAVPGRLRTTPPLTPSRHKIYAFTRRVGARSRFLGAESAQHLRVGAPSRLT